jgi:phosphohistidine phosphatase SixA
MFALLFSRLMGATKTGLSSLLARHMANHRGPDALASFAQLVYFKKVGTWWYLLLCGNPAQVPCWPVVGHLPTVDTREKSEYSQLSCVVAFSRAV